MNTEKFKNRSELSHVHQNDHTEHQIDYRTLNFIGFFFW